MMKTLKMIKQVKWLNRGNPDCRHRHSKLFSETNGTGEILIERFVCYDCKLGRVTKIKWFEEKT